MAAAVGSVHVYAAHGCRQCQPARVRHCLFRSRIAHRLTAGHRLAALAAPIPADERSALTVSVVVPVYNEEASVAPLVARVHAAMIAGGWKYELLLVDDGSRDGTAAALALAAAASNQIGILTFRRNCGQTAAMAAGLAASRGDIVVTLDADLQNDPADIPTLLGVLLGGAGTKASPPDLVCGWRQHRVDPGIRTLPSRWANAIIRQVTGTTVQDAGCSLKAYRRWLADALAPQLTGELHRYIPALAVAEGATVAEVAVSHAPRTAGTSKYSALGRVPRVLCDLVTVVALTGPTRGPPHAARPLHAVGPFAMALLACGLLATLAGGVAAATGATSLTTFVTSSVGPLLLMAATVQLLVMGLMAELLSRVYAAVRRAAGVSSSSIKSHVPASAWHDSIHGR